VKTIRTTKIKITGSRKANDIIKNYIQAINWLSPIVFNSKEMNSNRVAKAYYPVLRGKFHLPAQLACSICKHITATYKTAKSNKRWKLAVFKNATIPLVWRRDFNICKTKGVTLWSDPIVLHHPNIPPKDWKDSKLKKVRNKLYLILSYEKEITEPRTKGCIVGVDSGIKRMLVASNSSNSTPFFFPGGKLNHLRKCIRLRRAKIQAVGTRSSRRLLVRFAHKEAAITEHLMHVASKALTQYADKVGARVVVFEDLSNVREASLKKGQNLKEKVCRWPYASLQFKAGYKLAEKGIGTVTINPAYTSQTCPRCGHIAKGNRIGLQFRCVACGHGGDADLNASENIRNKHITNEQRLFVMGYVNTPEKSGYDLEMISHNSVICSGTQV
jgi:putative transposase